MKVILATAFFKLTVKKLNNKYINIIIDNNNNINPTMDKNLKSKKHSKSFSGSSIPIKKNETINQYSNSSPLLGSVIGSDRKLRLTKSQQDLFANRRIDDGQIQNWEDLLSGVVKKVEQRQKLKNEKIKQWEELMDHMDKKMSGSEGPIDTGLKY